MITDAQRKRLYFPLWRRAFQAVWERQPSGALTERAGLASSAARQMVMDQARVYAAPEVRGVVEGDLRHAATALALAQARSHRCGSLVSPPGTPEGASSRHLDGLSLDLFLALCELVVDETWLGTEDRPGLLDWESPRRIEHRRLLVRLDRGTAPGYAAALSRDLYGTRDYHELDYERLLALHNTLRDRHGAWRPARLPLPARRSPSASPLPV